MNSENRKRITIKHILTDKNNWQVFKETRLSKVVPTDMIEDVVEQVEKALNCGNPQTGYTLYKCPHCFEEHIVPFTCKSRFCSSCGKRYVDKWVDKQVETIINVSHRHVVFTVPEELRKYIYWNRKLLKEMSDAAAEVIQGYYYEQAKSREYEVGVITVVHTFGRDLGFNPHIHALITEGALDKYNQWKSTNYISFEYLRKAWQKVLLDIFKKHYESNTKVKNLIRMLYNKNKEGFYVNAESFMKDARGAAKYIGRYLARPAIAEYRILEYNGAEVKFWYEDHKTKQKVELVLSVMEFIGRMIMHVQSKHFRMVRRYGLYRRNFNARAKKIVSLWQYMKNRQIRLILIEKQTRKKNWRERIIESFQRDPLICKQCGEKMILWEIWSPKHDFIFHIENTDEQGRYIKKTKWEEDPRNERRRLAASTGVAIPFPRRQGRVV